MAGMQRCARCGAPVAADAAWCGKCGLEPGTQPKAARANPAQANPGWPPQPTKAQPAWSPKAVGATPAWPALATAKSSGEAPLILWWRGLSRNAKIGLSAAAIIALVAAGAVGAASGTPSATGSPSSSSPAGVAAASDGPAGPSASDGSAGPSTAGSTVTPTIAASTATPDSDDQGAPSAGASFNPTATGALPPSGGGSAADRLPGEPDPNLTPGALNPAVTQKTIGSTICVSGWTATIRPSESFTNSLKVTQIGQYGYSDTSTASYEEDHLISLELGGAPADPRNLWPEPYTDALADGRPTGAHTKDSFETKLKTEVCAGTITLAQAQGEIGDHWIHAYYGIAVSSPTAAPTPAPTPAPTAVVTARPATPAPTAPAAPITVAITGLPASVTHGANATMVAVTSPGATCSASVTYASGTVSNAAGLQTHPVADSTGTVSWTWKVGASTGPGTSQAYVTCSLGGSSGSASKDFQVT